jgi:hypothetical protein
MNAMKTLVLVIAGVLAIRGAADARIKLVALPDRDATIIRLDNPQFTLVEEERTLTLQKGRNQVDFSWKGVSIDADSIRLRLLSHPDDAKLISVSYPPNEAALVWEIFTPQPFEEKARISYLLSGIDRLVTYKALATEDESRLDLKSYVVLRNFSGEVFQTARVQLDAGEGFEKSIAHEETKEVLFLAGEGVPIEKTFTWDDAMPWDPEKVAGNVGIPVFYAFANAKPAAAAKGDGKEAAGIGQTPLWPGKARVFQKDGHGSSIFLGEDNGEFTPVGEKMKLRIGDSRDVVVTQRKMRDDKVNLRKNNAGAVVLHDTDELVDVKVENFKDKPAVLVLTEHIPGQWEMKECTHKFERKDAATIEFRLELKPKEKVALTMHFSRKNVR